MKNLYLCLILLWAGYSCANTIEIRGTELNLNGQWLNIKAFHYQKDHINHQYSIQRLELEELESRMNISLINNKLSSSVTSGYIKVDEMDERLIWYFSPALHKAMKHFTELQLQGAEAKSFNFIRQIENLTRINISFVNDLILVLKEIEHLKHLEEIMVKHYYDYSNDLEPKKISPEELNILTQRKWALIYFNTVDFPLGTVKLLTTIHTRELIIINSDFAINPQPYFTNNPKKTTLLRIKDSTLKGNLDHLINFELMH